MSGGRTGHTGIGSTSDEDSVERGDRHEAPLAEVEKEALQRVGREGEGSEEVAPGDQAGVLVHEVVEDDPLGITQTAEHSADGPVLGHLVVELGDEAARLRSGDSPEHCQLGEASGGQSDE
jgi:hypothetical protein